MNDQDKTKIIRRPKPEDNESTRLISEAGTKKVVEDGEGTRIYRPRSPAGASSQSGLDTSQSPEFFTDPVVGWLVISAGPGKGSSFQLRFGMNSIGRGSDVKIKLDFGDSEISREPHAFLTFDRRNKKYYLQHAEGSNLTYIGNTPVLTPTELQGFERISIGSTELVFVPLCGRGFDWDAS